MSTVYFAETANREDFISKIIKIFKTKINQAKSIFIKPNVVSSEHYPTTTHPETLDAILSQISQKKIVVGDGHAVDTGYTSNILANSPLAEVCDRHDVEFVNLYKKKMRKWTSPRGYNLKFSLIPFEFDFIISLPVLKVHKQCGISGALKNQFGYLSKFDRILMHSKIKDIHKGIAELNVAYYTNLFIVDAIETLIKAQECRHGGSPARLGTLIAGVDPVSLDTFGQKLLKTVDINLEEKIKHLNYAEQYRVGKKEYKILKI